MRYSFLFLLFLYSSIMRAMPLYFCTAANAPYYGRLLNLIGCLHKVDFDDIQEIAVFDLGLTTQQRSKLKTIKKVNVYDVQKVHPDILKPVQVAPGKSVPGWYAWKPVAIKQSLEMFPYVLWIDAGTVILKSLKNVFSHIIENGYMLVHGGPHPLHRHTTQRVINLFDLNSDEKKWVLEAPSIAAFWVGVTRQMGQQLVDPIAELASDLKNFEDDGSSTWGFGWGRYEQALLSIKAHLLGLKIQYTSQIPTHIHLNVNGQRLPFNMTWESSKFHRHKDLYDVYYQVRNSLGYERYIQYK